MMIQPSLVRTTDTHPQAEQDINQLQAQTLHTFGADKYHGSPRLVKFEVWAGLYRKLIAEATVGRANNRETNKYIEHLLNLLRAKLTEEKIPIPAKGFTYRFVGQKPAQIDTLWSSKQKKDLIQEFFLYSSQQVQDEKMKSSVQEVEATNA